VTLNLVHLVLTIIINQGKIDLRWYMFDQVLIRPDLLDYFDIQDLRILTSDGDTNFLSRNGIPRKEISDHLPLIFKLNLDY